MKKYKLKALLIFIVLVGFTLRIYNTNWDKGHIFHPDERAIIMNAIQLEYPSSPQEFFSKESRFNTNFFAYGNLPIYILKIAGDKLSHLNPAFSEYTGIYLVGRAVSSLFSTLTVILIFLYTKRLFDGKSAFLSAFFYAIAVFPIQNSHFYTVDTILTFFTLLTLFFLDWYLIKRNLLSILMIGISLGIALATKISITPIVAVLTAAIILSNVIEYKNVYRVAYNSLKSILLILISALFIFILSQPYVAIDYKDFLEQVTYQSKMGSDPFIFPYTLQYADKVSYFYELKNIMLWGLGLPLGVLALTGLIICARRLSLNFKKNFIFFPSVAFTIGFFLINGSYAVGWMRYLLPIYPFLVIFAGAAVIVTLNKIKKHTNKKAVMTLILFSTLLWTFSFMSIYTKPHTKFTASDWINKNIPAGSTLAMEHWDDQLPIYNTSKYNYEILAMYDEDTIYKWQTIERQLANSDYIVLASNRLYTPLQKLTDCSVLPKHRCYPITAKYYQDLFSEKIGFSKVAEFTSYPTIPILNIEINDQSADESFAVYDHPKITVFKKN